MHSSSPVPLHGRAITACDRSGLHLQCRPLPAALSFRGRSHTAARQQRLRLQTTCSAASAARASSPPDDRGCWCSSAPVNAVSHLRQCWFAQQAIDAKLSTVVPVIPTTQCAFQTFFSAANAGTEQFRVQIQTVPWRRSTRLQSAAHWMTCTYGSSSCSSGSTWP